MTDSEHAELPLVEDNPQDAELTVRALRKGRLGNTVHIVKDGAEALDFFFDPTRGIVARKAPIPLLVLLDLKLPKVDGKEVLRRLKTDPRTSLIPVVVLTSSREESYIVQSYQSGANSYIVKPVDFAKFSDAVAEMGKYWLVLNAPPRAVAST